MKSLYLLFVISIVSCNDISAIFGNWTLLATFPKSDSYIACAKTTVTDEHRTVKCACDNVEAEYPVIKMHVHPFSENIEWFNYTAAVKVVNDYDPVVVDGFFNKTCECDGSTRLGLVRIVDGNFILHYRKHYTSEREPNKAALHAKQLPTKVQLVKLVSSDEELKNRDIGYACEDLIF